MIPLALFFVAAGVPAYLFLRRWRRVLGIGRVYTAVLTVPIVGFLWFALQWIVELGRT
jgi:hypothetical protein